MIDDTPVIEIIQPTKQRNTPGLPGYTVVRVGNTDMCRCNGCNTLSLGPWCNGCGRDNSWQRMDIIDAALCSLDAPPLPAKPI